MTPVSFDGCLGLLHEADGGAAVVMCGAPGFEQLCAHRGWRELADALAARGFPTLRFDWRGCGDSLGGDGDPARVAAWEESLELALAFARKTLRPRRIVLVGLRFGATLAASVAARDRGVDGLALLAPAISGRLHGRELAGLARVMAPLSPDTVEDGLSVAGFRASQETLEAMKAYDLRTLEARPADRAILFAPDGQAGAAEAAEHWRALGCAARLDPFDGCAEAARPSGSEWG